MGCYQRTKFAVDAFRNVSSRITHNKWPIHQYNNPTKCSFHEFNELASPSLIRSYSLNHCLLHQNHANRFFLDEPKRFYCVSKPEANIGYRESFKNRLHELIVLGLRTARTVIFWDLEIVPYTKRKRFVLSQTSTQRYLDEIFPKYIKAKFEGKVLDAEHPQSVKVRLIVEDIIESVRGKVDKEKGDNTVHLEGLNWELVVVDDPEVKACCLRNGKIVVYTGILNLFTSDDEIATVIGHEVAHIVAQHAKETMTKTLTFLIPLTLLCSYKVVLFQGVWVVTPLMLFCYLFDTHIYYMTVMLFRRLPSIRRMEIEADYIGLMLMASAGYDPRVAPKVYKRLGELDGEDSTWKEYYQTHPSSRKRVQLLDKVMEEALLLYPGSASQA